MFIYYSSDSALTRPVKKAAAAESNTVVDWFFFKPGDPRLVDGAKRFTNTLNDETLRKKWEEIRPKLVEVCYMSYLIEQMGEFNL